MSRPRRDGRDVGIVYYLLFHLYLTTAVLSFHLLIPFNSQTNEVLTDSIVVSADAGMASFNVHGMVCYDVHIVIIQPSCFDINIKCSAVAILSTIVIRSQEYVRYHKMVMMLFISNTESLRAAND